MGRRTFLGLGLSLMMFACGEEAEPAAESSTAAIGEITSLDPRFGTGGILRGKDVADGAKNAVAYDDVGRMLLLSADWGDRAVLRAERRLPDGSLDRSFASGAIPLLLPPLSGSLEVQPLADGSLAVAASAICALSTCPYDPDEPGKVRRFVFHLGASGSLDGAFANGKGFLEFDSPRRGDLATYPIRLARSPGGELVIAVDQPKGAVDVHWVDTKGVVLRKHSVEKLTGETRSLVATASGAVLGRAGYDPNRPGQLDSFGQVVGVDRGTGRVNPGMGEWSAMEPQSPLVTRVVATARNVWVIGGADVEGDYGPGRVAVRKLGLDLLTDHSFGTNGTKIFNAGTGQGGRISDLRVLADGRIVLVGSFEVEGHSRRAPNGEPSLVPGDDYDLGYVVLRPNGAYDTSFAARGTLLVHAGSTDEALVALHAGPQGVFAAGFSGRTPVLTKLHLP